MKKLLNAAFIYLLAGLAAGLFYREFTKLNDWPEGQFTQLGLTHTHLLTLGFMVLLTVLALEKIFAISTVSPKLFAWFFGLYNAGVVLTSGMMVWHGSLTVLGEESTAMIAGIAGLGHIFLTAATIVFLIALRRAVNAKPATTTAAAEPAPAR